MTHYIHCNQNDLNKLNEIIKILLLTCKVHLGYCKTSITTAGMMTVRGQYCTV